MQREIKNETVFLFLWFLMLKPSVQRLSGSLMSLKYLKDVGLKVFRWKLQDTLFERKLEIELTMS